MGSTWMSRLSNDTRISQLSIPGTHDSHCTRDNLKGMNSWGMIGRMIETQDTGIYQQLKNGVRYVDLRVGEGKRMRHGKVELRGELGDCLNEIDYFLKENSSEAVLVHIMWDHPDVDEPDWFTEHVREQWWNHRWEYSNEWPTLGGIRGRALLLRRFKDNSKSSVLGIDVRQFFGKDHSDTSQGKWDSSPQGNQSGDDYNDKWNMVQQHLQKAMNSSKDDNVVYITNSAGVYLFQGVQQRMPADYAEMNNPKLVYYLKDLKGKQRLGVVQMDFINEEASRLIYEKNF